MAWNRLAQTMTNDEKIREVLEKLDGRGRTSFFSYRKEQCCIVSCNDTGLLRMLNKILPELYIEVCSRHKTCFEEIGWYEEFK